MKINTDFVTNSSSNNFLFGFKNAADFQEFKQYCEMYGYDMVYNLVNNIRKSQKGDFASVKADIIKRVYHYYSFDIRQELYEKKVPEIASMSYNDAYQVRQNLDAMGSFEEEVRQLTIQNTEYAKVEDRINECSLLYSGMIWDTDGGLFEWACRNNFLNDEFRKWCIVSYNIG
jgi:hypothetical protein